MFSALQERERAKAVREEMLAKRCDGGYLETYVRLCSRVTALSEPFSI